jgi:DNA-binding NarL/FixJ family response regulator
MIGIPPNLEIEIVEINGETLLVLHFETTQASSAKPILSSAEAEVLRALASGLTNAQIAAARGTSPRTVANQVQSLLRKFGMQSRHQLGAKGQAS